MHSLDRGWFSRVRGVPSRGLVQSITTAMSKTATVPSRGWTRAVLSDRRPKRRRDWMSAFRSVSGVSNLGQYEDMYRVGISFKNPKGYLHPIEARKFNLVKYGAIGAKKKFSVRKPLWRSTINKRAQTQLGCPCGDMPTFDELSLGQAATPTTQSTAVTRNFWGSLTNLITAGAEVFQKREEAKITKLQAEIQAREAELRPEAGIPTRAGIGSLPLILGLGGGALLIGTLMLRKK